jgi:hypothetical protein
MTVLIKYSGMVLKALGRNSFKKTVFAGYWSYKMVGIDFSKKTRKQKSSDILSDYQHVKQIIIYNL